MEFIPVMKLSESILPGQGEPNVSEVQGVEHWPGAFNAILESELGADKTNNSNEEEGETQDVLLGLVPAIYEETLSGSDVENGFMPDDIPGEAAGVDIVISEKIALPKDSSVTASSSPVVALIDEQAVQNQGVQGKVVDINSQSVPEQKTLVSKGIVAMPGNPVMNSTSEHPESELNVEKVIAIEASQQKGFDKPVSQKTAELFRETVPKVAEEEVDSLKEIDTPRVKEKPAVLPGDMKGQVIEETMGNVKPLLKAEGNENKTSLTKESFEKTFQLDSSPKATAHLSNDENSHAQEDSGSFRSNQGSSALNFQKMTSQDSKVDFTQITTLSSTETVQGTVSAAPGGAVDSLTEVDALSLKEVKPQAVSRGVEDQLMDQVSNSVRLTLKQGGGEARMRLYPESLGELKVELSVEEGVMKAKFLVSNAMVKDVIEDNFHRLRDSLANNGLKVDSFSVSVDQQGKGSDLESSSFSQFEGDDIVDKEAPLIDQHEDLPEHSRVHSDADDSMINIFT